MILLTYAKNPNNYNPSKFHALANAKLLTLDHVNPHFTKKIHELAFNNNK
jgi:hypothetical protein